jgi:DNA polymerase-3 subunit beta
MKFVIAKEDLQAVISNLQNVVSQRPALPLLANFLLEAQGEELVFTATDLTVGMRCYTAAKVLEPGGTTLPARRFFQLVRELTAPQLEISTNAGEVTEIVAGASRFRLNGMSRSEYPQLPDFSGALTFKMTQGGLKEQFYRTAFAVSREDTRYALTGVLMHINGGVATLVGTDGKRLAKSEIKVPVDPSHSGRYIIPLKAVEEMSKLLKDNDEEVTLSLMSDKMAMEANQTLLITKLLSGEYPDFQRVIPQKSEILLSLHREELMSLLRQVSLFTAENSQSVRFSLFPGELTLSANNSEIGEGKVSMPVSYQGPRFDIAFNPSFFLDILRHSPDDAISVGLTDPYNPGVIRDSSSALFVLMPMRFSEV